MQNLILFSIFYFLFLNISVAKNLSGVMYSYEAEIYSDKGLVLKKPKEDGVKFKKENGKMILEAPTNTLIAVKQNNGKYDILKGTNYSSSIISIDEDDTVKGETNCGNGKNCLTVTPQLCGFLSFSNDIGSQINTERGQHLARALTKLKEDIATAENCSYALSNIEMSLDSFLDSSAGKTHQKIVNDNMKAIKSNLGHLKGVPDDLTDYLLNLKDKLKDLKSSFKYFSALGEATSRCKELSEHNLLPKIQLDDVDVRKKGNN